MNLSTEVAAPQETRKRPFRARKGEWTWTECRVIAQNYPRYDDIAAILPHRSRVAIKLQAQAMGLTPKRYIWSAREIRTLKAMYGTATQEEILAALPGLTWSQITSRAGHFGLSRNPEPVRFADPLLQSVRDRARAMKITLADLDLDLGIKYWSKAVTKRNLKHVAAAVEALGGELVIKWEDLA